MCIYFLLINMVYELIKIVQTIKYIDKNHVKLFIVLKILTKW